MKYNKHNPVWNIVAKNHEKVNEKLVEKNTKLELYTKAQPKVETVQKANVFDLTKLQADLSNIRANTDVWNIFFKHLTFSKTVTYKDVEPGKYNLTVDLDLAIKAGNRSPAIDTFEVTVKYGSKKTTESWGLSDPPSAGVILFNKRHIKNIQIDDEVDLTVEMKFKKSGSSVYLSSELVDLDNTSGTAMLYGAE